MHENSHILVYAANCILLIVPLIVNLLLCMYKHAGKITPLIVRTLTHSSFCIFNFMFPSCSPNLTKVAVTTHKVERAWSSHRATYRRL